MKPLHAQTHYEVLEVAPTAQVADIRASYERLRRLLGPGSLAVYSLVDPEEQEALVLRLDQAWAVLSHEAERRAYDASIGLTPQPPAPAPRSSFRDALAVLHGAAQGEPVAAPVPDEAPVATAAAPERESEPPVIPLGDDDLLEVLEIGGGEMAGVRIAQIVDAGDDVLLAEEAEAAIVAESLEAEDAAAAADEPDAVAELGDDDILEAEEIGAEPELEPEPYPDRAPAMEAAPPAAAAPGPDTIFTGSVLRELRKARGLSVEEIARRTRISAGHLVNLEEERWADLPERVFLRGFLTAYARELRLDAARVCDTYLARREGARSR